MAATVSTIGAEFPVTRLRAVRWDYSHEIVYNATDDEYLSVWLDRRSGRNLVYGQRISASGERLGSNFRIGKPDHPDEWHLQPVVAWNSARNEYLVVWGANGVGTVGQRLSAAGDRLGKRFTLTVGARRDLAFNPRSGRYLVVWREAQTVYGRILDGDGAEAGEHFRVSGKNALIGPSESWPHIGVNPTRNQFLVVWDGVQAETRDNVIYGQRLAADGTRLGWSLRISRGKGTGGVLESTVAYSPAVDRYLVVWEDLRNRNERGSGIMGQLVTADGNRPGRNFRVSGNKAADERFPSIACDLANGDCLVTWTDARRPSVPDHYNDIFAQHLTRAGDRTGPDLRVTRHRAVLPIGPGALAYGSRGNEYLVLWNDDRRPTTDIYAQRLTP